MRPSPVTKVTPSRWSRTGPNPWRRGPVVAVATTEPTLRPPSPGGPIASPPPRAASRWRGGTKSCALVPRSAFRVPPSGPHPFAARVHRHHLPRVDPLLGVEHAPQGAHRGEGVGIEDERHVAQLVEADPVLAGDRATGRDAGFHDLPARRLDARAQAGDPAVE